MTGLDSKAWGNPDMIPCHFDKDRICELGGFHDCCLHTKAKPRYRIVWRRDPFPGPVSHVVIFRIPIQMINGAYIHDRFTKVYPYP